MSEPKRVGARILSRLTVWFAGISGASSLPSLSSPPSLSALEGAPNSRGPWRGVLEMSSRGLALIGFAGAALVEGVPSAAALAGALLLLPAAYLSRQPNAAPYQAAWNLATLLFVSVSLLFNRWTLSSTLQTLATLCCFLQLHRAFNHRTPRHYLQIWLLTVMSLILAPLSLEVPPVRYALLLAAFFAASVIHFGAMGWMKDCLAIEAASGSAPASAAAGGSKAAGGAWGMGAAKYLGVWMRLGLLSGAAAAALFLTLPRPFLPPLPEGGAAMRSARSRQRLLTGFSQGIDLSYLSSLREDSTIAARIRGLPPMIRENCRLRAAAMDFFDGDRWVRVPSPGMPARIERRPDAPEFRWREPGGPQKTTTRWTPVTVALADFPFRYLLVLPESLGAGGFMGDLLIEEDGALLPASLPSSLPPPPLLFNFSSFPVLISRLPSFIRGPCLSWFVRLFPFAGPPGRRRVRA